jgi:hypothetical protein
MFCFITTVRESDKLTGNYNLAESTQNCHQRFALPKGRETMLVLPGTLAKLKMQSTD